MYWLLELATAVAAKGFSVKERSQNRRYAAVGSEKSGRNGIDCRGRRLVLDESPTKFGCNVPGGGGVGGNDKQYIIQILPAVHAIARRDRLAKDEFLSAIVKPGLVGLSRSETALGLSASHSGSGQPPLRRSACNRC